jgi:thiamine kinase-like enzyme
LNVLTDQEKIELRLPIIKAMTDQHGIEIGHVDFVAGGKTNESYIVYSTDSHKYLARIAGKGTEEFIDRKKEMHNVAVADRIGVAPKLLCTNNNNLLLEYIDGICTTNQDILLIDGNIDKITEQLRKLHASSECFQGNFSFIHDFHVYKRDFLSTGYSVPDEMKENEEELYAMVKWTDDSLCDDLCPCHSDIVLQNFIFTQKRAYIVDWEYSTMAGRYLDLASFCTQNILQPETTKMFLDSYFANGDVPMDYGKFLLYKMSISFMWIYWHLNNIAHNKDTEYNKWRWKLHYHNAIDCKKEWERLWQAPTEWR